MIFALEENVKMDNRLCPKCGAPLISRIYYVAGNPVVDWFCACCHNYSSASVGTYSTNSTSSLNNFYHI